MQDGQQKVFAFRNRSPKKRRQKIFALFVLILKRLELKNYGVYRFSFNL